MSYKTTADYPRDMLKELDDIARFTTGGLDLFRDETIDYSQRLMAAGVRTELAVYPGVWHKTDSDFWKGGFYNPHRSPFDAWLSVASTVRASLLDKMMRP